MDLPLSLCNSFRSRNEVFLTVTGSTCSMPKNDNIYTLTLTPYWAETPRPIFLIFRSRNVRGPDRFFPLSYWFDKSTPAAALGIWGSELHNKFRQRLKKMLASLRARVLNQRDIVSSNTHLGLLHFQAFLLNFTKNFAVKPSSGERKEEGQKVSNPLVVSFLINSCGLSPKSAESASRQVNFKSLDNPNSLLKLLKSYGFTQTQIATVFRICPKLLNFNAQEVIMPKLEFFRSRRISSPELTRYISRNPNILELALDKTISPCFDSLKNVACLDDKQVMVALTRRFLLRLSNLHGRVAPNIALLRGLGVPQSSISLLVTCYPMAAFLDHAVFVKLVEEVKELEFDPSKSVFVIAIHALSKMTKSKWESKFEVFGRHGWSKENVFEAFRRHPMCLALGEKNIDRTMDFLVNEMGRPSKDFAKKSELLFYSLENRIKPRCSVIQVLMSKGLVDQDLSLSLVLAPKEEQFLERFVTKFQEAAPELLTVYKGKKDVLALRKQDS